MIVYRIAKNKYIEDLSGKGAELYGGRWNSEGRPVLYTSAFLSLSVLELLANQVWRHVSVGYSFISIEVPDQVKVDRLSPNDLPVGWNQSSYHIDTLRRGDNWLKANDSVGLWVPSAVLTQENNLLLNPAHTDFKSIKTKEVSDLRIDHRILNVT